MLINKIPYVSGLMTATVLNTKNAEAGNKIPDTSGLVPTTVLTTKIGEAKNKIPEVSGLVKKVDYNSKISDIEIKYFDNSEYEKFKWNTWNENKRKKIS